MSQLTITSTCGKCKKPNNNGKKTCNTCLEGISSNTKNRKIAWREAGLCGGCGKHPPEIGKKTCSSCLAIRANYRQRRRKKLKNMGYCTTCYKFPSLSGKKTCEMCIDKNNSSRRKFTENETCYKCKINKITTGRLCKSCSENNKNQRMERITQGICTECEAPVWESYKKCFQCLSKVQNKRLMRKNSNKCSNCPNEKDPGKSLCLECLNKANKIRKKKVHKAKEGGLCRDCGKSITKGARCVECQKKKRQQTKNYRISQKKRGLCVTCAKKALPGKTRCAACAKHHAQKSAELRKCKKEKGECLKCSNPAALGKLLCTLCAKIQSEKSSARKQTLISLAKCIACGKENVTNNDMCERCSSKSNLRSLKSRQTKIKKELCTTCGNRKAVPGETLCLQCKDARKLKVIENKNLSKCKCGRLARPGKSTCRNCGKKAGAASKRKRSQAKKIGQCVKSGCKNKPMPSRVMCEKCSRIKNSGNIEYRKQLKLRGICDRCLRTNYGPSSTCPVCITAVKNKKKKLRLEELQEFYINNFNEDLPENDRPGIVYLAINKVNKKVYVGETSRTLNMRISQHIRAAQKSPQASRNRGRFIPAIRKHGAQNFSFIVLQHCRNDNERYRAEYSYIGKYNATDPACGYNTIDGTIKRAPRNKEERKKMGFC